MKIVATFFLVLCFAAIVWLGFNQATQHRRLANLESENLRLAAEVSRLATDGVHRAEAMQPKPVPAPETGARLWTGMSMPRTPRSNILLETRNLDVPPARISSSHSADGQLLERSWGPEQVLGPSNTPGAGDYSTAWAQSTSSGGDEWLQVKFSNVVEVAEVIVRETYNPGAIAKVTGISLDGNETAIWEGTEPPIEAPVDVSFPSTQKVRANSIKIYLDRRRVSGWNEIDSVELVGRDGSRQWASSATASSSFAEP